MKNKKAPVLLLFIASILHAPPPISSWQQAPEPEPHEPWITVFVHGTVGLRQTLSIKSIPTLFKDSIDGSKYKRKVQKFRDDATSYQNQPTQARGMIKINMSGEPQNGAELFARLYDEQQKHFYPHQNTVAYYTYGWSGLIHSTERYLAAEHFLETLKKIVEELRVHHPDLKIRIVGYSHGSNVALNLAEVNANNPKPVNFVVNELIMVGTPVQRETDCFIADPFFVQGYSIYSRGDYIQKLDCFSSIRIFSGRRFRDSARCVIGDKLQQIELKVSIAADQDRKAYYNSKKRIDRSPGHIELWNFGWPGASSIYRDHFPLSPLPAALFIPALIKTAQTYQPHTRHLVMEMQPDRNSIKIRKRHCSKKTVAPFVTSEHIETMKQTTHNFYEKKIMPLQKSR